MTRRLSSRQVTAEALEPGAGVRDAAPANAFRVDRRPQIVLLLLCLAALALVWTGVALFVRSQEDAALERVRAEVGNLAIAFDEQVKRTLLSVDQMLRFTKAAFEENPEGFDLAAWLRRMPPPQDVVLQVAIANTRGDVESNLSRPTSPPVNIADREHFQVHAANPDAGLFLSRPVLGRVSGRWSIQASRRLNDPEGAFAGVVVMSIDPDAIARAFGNINIGSKGSVNLVGLDGYVRARTPPIEGMFEVDLAHHDLGRSILAILKRTGSGVERLVSPLDGIDRMFGYRTLPDLQLVIAVGASIDDALAPVRARRAWIFTSGGIVSLVLLAAFGLLLRQLEIRRAHEIELATANRALAEEEARYRLLADNATDVIARIGIDGIARYISPAAKDVLGYRPEELVGADSLQFVHPEDRDWVLKHFRDLVRAGPHAPRSSLVYRGWHKDGRWTWLEVNPTAVFDPVTGNATEVVDVIRDVSHRKQVEDELRRKTEFLETTLESMDQGLVMIDADGRVVVCNRRAIDLMGFPPDLMARTPHYQEVRRHMMKQGEFAASDEDFQKWISDGSLVPKHLSYERVRPNGTIVEVCTVSLAGGGVVRTYTDITARRKAEEAGRESEKRYRLLAENASDIIMLRVVGGERTYVSPASYSMLGYTPEEFLKLPTEALIHPDDHPQLNAIYRDLSCSRREIRDVHRLRHKQGHWVWVEAVFKLMEPGKEPLVLAAIRDVTERQRQAEELKAAKEAAEELLRKAEEASQAKSDFLASMSHEIRTPLNSILGFTNLVLESGNLEPEQRRHIEQVKGAGSALRTIVDDVLDFSKIEAGQVEFDLQPFALRGLLDNAVSIVRGIAVERAIPIEVEINPAVPETVVGDVDRLRQILLNLLNNAVKFTLCGHVSLSVRRCGERLRFAVTDTGIGIPQDKLPRLFGRFTQVDSSIRRRFGGTGLGLAISKRLVELMGGQIGVDSREGEGSTFWFEVALPEGRAAQGLTEPVPLAGSCRAARILLVEDVDINQELARLILQRAGHEVNVASNGVEALEAIQTTSYDLILMDVQMPVMDGITATERIRCLNEPVASIPIIAMTANVLPGQVAKFKLAGMNDHIGKPFQVGELLAAVARWTERPARRAPIGARS